MKTSIRAGQGALSLLRPVSEMADELTRVIEFRANPVQRAFIESKAKADLFSSRMGEGKSAGLCWAVFHHTSQNPGARWALIRDTWENLQATTQKEFFKWFPPGIMGTYNASQKTFTWAVDGMGRGEVQFLGMDDPKDASKLQSRELGGFGIDEPAPAAESGGVDEMIFDVAMSRLRQQGMNWYAAKLAQNNPDETHWTYRRFVDPGTGGFVAWQTDKAENVHNLPPDYYEGLRSIWAHRPDIVTRFVEGQYGFMQKGKKVTPEWNDRIHLATGLIAVPGRPLYLLWDFGHNPTCLITQVTPLGHWNIIESYVGEDIGVQELIEAVVKPRLEQTYKKFSWSHIGDPAGTSGEQTSIKRSPVLMIRKELGGRWISGPVKWADRVEPLKGALRQLRGDRGLIQVDRQKAQHVWHALRGGWHYHVARTGIVSTEAEKDIHSHPGDAMGYGAAVLFPLGKPGTKKRPTVKPKTATFFGQGLGFERPGAKLPPQATRLP